MFSQVMFGSYFRKTLGNTKKVFKILWILPEWFFLGKLMSCIKIKSIIGRTYTYKYFYPYIRSYTMDTTFQKLYRYKMHI